MRTAWNNIDPNHWALLHARSSPALQQDWHYGDSLAPLGIGVHRAQVTLDTEPIALAQFICRRYGPLGTLALCTRGPFWVKPVPPEIRAETYHELKRTIPLKWPRVVMFSPDLQNTDDGSLARLTRVLTGDSTVLIDLSQSLQSFREGMTVRWRNRLAASEKAGLKIIRTRSGDSRFHWLLEQEANQRKTKGFSGLPLQFVENYAKAGGPGRRTIFMLSAEADGARIASMLFLLHGSAATYYLGWANDTARKVSAHNLLLLHAFAALKEAGLSTLNLGGINTRNLPGISRFKIGTGGRVVTYAGTFI